MASHGVALLQRQDGEEVEVEVEVEGVRGRCGGCAVAGAGSEAGCGVVVVNGLNEDGLCRVV